MSKRRDHRRPQQDLSPSAGQPVDPASETGTPVEIQMTQPQPEGVIANAEQFYAVTVDPEVPSHPVFIPSVLSTENMPGAEPLVVLVECNQIVLPREESKPLRVYIGAQLGSQTRRVLNTRDVRPHKTIRVTFRSQEVYEIEFENGVARIPEVIADFIQIENPGNCMRLD